MPRRRQERNRQTMVSVTLARGEVPVMLGLARSCRRVGPAIRALADAGYGLSAPFRPALSDRRLACSGIGWHGSGRLIAAAAGAQSSLVGTRRPHQYATYRNLLSWLTAPYRSARFPGGALSA